MSGCVAREIVPFSFVCSNRSLHFNLIQLHVKNLLLDSKTFRLDHDVDLQVIAASCNGYVGADLEALCGEAVRLAYRRVSETPKDASVIKLTMEDWKHATDEVGPSMTRGVTIEFKKVLWDDIGGLKDLKVW